MPDLVVARHHKVAKAAKRAKKSGVVSDFHRLRIGCKRLRYALEFSSEVYGGRTSRFVRQLTGLQDQLGLMQDAEVASIRLADLATGEAHLPAATVFVMGGLAELHRRDVDRLLRRLPKEVSRIGGREWRDLADLMERRRAEAEEARPPVRHALRAVPAPVVEDPATGTPGQEELAHPAAGPGLAALAPPSQSSQGE
jgi:hypothetical protein